MTSGSKGALHPFAAADEIQVWTHSAAARIWCVAVDDALFVRAYHGRSSRWYQAAVKEKRGRIGAGEVRVEVAFEPAAEAIAARVDAAYRAKYRGSPYLDAMIGASARAATLEVTPLDSR